MTVDHYWCEAALVDGAVAAGVAVEVEHGRFRAVTLDARPAPGVRRLHGLTIGGLANAHSHLFHRALRSRTQRDRGTFWTWRELMYRAAAALNPDIMFRLATATLAEMACAGVTTVGEFHYVHHQPDGTPYPDRDRMGEAILSAAADVGVRLTLLDTLYLHGGLDERGYQPITTGQRRFSDRSVERWIERVAGLPTAGSDQGGHSRPSRIGCAVHSVRAVDPGAITTLTEWARSEQAPLHAHVSEQVAENEACVAHHGRSPMAVLAAAGAVNQRFSAVHATHLDDRDVQLLADGGASVVMCPTTERDLGDGIGPSSELVAAGVPLAVGSDSHAVIDLLEECRAIELDERLRTRQRGHHGAADLLTAATVNGHRCLGWTDVGRIQVGDRADLVTISLRSRRTAGAARDGLLEAAVFAASAADVTNVVIDGAPVVARSAHTTVDVETALEASIVELMDP